MKNYLDYFIPKYQNAPGKLPEIKEKNGIYYINGRVVGEKPLSAKDPLLSLWVEGAALGKPLEVVGKGLGYIGKRILSKITPAKTITDRFFKFIGKEIPKTSITPIEFSRFEDQQQKLLLEQLEKSGVDISKVSYEDLSRALEKRMRTIYKSSPEIIRK